MRMSDVPVHDPFLQEAAASKLMEQQQVRRQLVTLFLHLRATNERDRSKWAAVLDEAFVMTLPITPYRYFPRTGVNHSLRLVSGITGAMVDAASLQVGPSRHSFLEFNPSPFTSNSLILM
jgi:hypothetical protein